MEKLNKQYVQRAGNDAVYGPGIDGDVTIASETTLTSDAYYNNLTITSSGFLNTNGFRVFVKNTLTIDSGGKIGVGPNSVGDDPSDVVDGTLAGHSSTSISYRIGGQGGGSTDPSIPMLPSFLLKDVNVLSNGLVFDPTMGIVVLQGGSKGTTGSDGATTPAYTDLDSWPGKSGAEGSPGGTSNYGNANPSANTVGVPGGKGNPASPGNSTGATPGLGGSGGSGGSGGPVVCVVAKTITGNGTIVSRGKRGTSGSPGQTGNPGTQGANGTAAPNSSHHVAPTSHPNPDARNFSHSHHRSVHSDFHAHASKAANHHRPASHTPASGKTPASHTPAAHHENPHYHHNGHIHHPHNDGPHGGMHHWYNYSWHRRYQVSHANAIAHNHVKPNGHHGGHNADHNAQIGNGTHQLDYTHQHAGGTNNNAHYGHGIIGHSHNHAPTPSVNANWTHHHVAPTSHANPDQVFPGGAGGVNNGTTTGKAAPAVTGGSGKHGGYGGGGAILVITDSVSGTITYDTSARTALDTDNFSATNGSAYVLINQ